MRSVTAAVLCEDHFRCASVQLGSMMNRMRYPFQVSQMQFFYLLSEH